MRERTHVLERGEQILQWAFVCLMLFVLGAGVSVGGHLLEEKREFCLSCHEMKPYGVWYHASGADRHHANCIICHSGPGVIGAVGAQMVGIRELSVHAFGTPSPAVSFRGVVPNENCLKCHVHGYNRAAHEGFPAREKSCAFCHNHYKDSHFGGDIPLGTFPASGIPGNVTRFLDVASGKQGRMSRHVLALSDHALPGPERAKRQETETAVIVNDNSKKGEMKK